MHFVFPRLLSGDVQNVHATASCLDRRWSLQEEEDENVEENEEYQEGKLRFAGGRKEEATYDAGDEEDKQIAADVRREAERQGGEEEVSLFAM